MLIKKKARGAKKRNVLDIPYVLNNNNKIIKIFVVANKKCFIFQLLPKKKKKKSIIKKKKIFLRINFFCVLLNQASRVIKIIFIFFPPNKIHQFVSTKKNKNF